MRTSFEELPGRVASIRVRQVTSPHVGRRVAQAAAAAVLPGAFAKARDGAVPRPPKIADDCSVQGRGQRTQRTAAKGWYFAFHSRAMGTIKRDEAMSVSSTQPRRAAVSTHF